MSPRDPGTHATPPDVLVAERDEALSEALAAVLASFELEVARAPDAGALAAELSRRSTPRGAPVVVSGASALRTLAAEARGEARRTAALVVLRERHDPPAEVLGRELAAAAVVERPVDLRRLSEIVVGLCRARAAWS